MATRRSRAAEFQIPPGADDFSSAIKGIGPGIAQRLYSAEVLTFAQLAALSPNKILLRIGNHPGLSTTRIAEEDWVGQARALMAKESIAQDMETPQGPPEEQAMENLPASKSPPKDLPSHQRYATFTVQLLLGADETVRRTRVTCVRIDNSNEEQQSWPGWDAERLLRYIVQQGRLNLPIEQAPSETVSIDAHALPDKPADEPATIVLRELVLVLSLESEPQHAVPQGKPGRTRLILDLTKLASLATRPDNYTIKIRAKRLSSGAQYILGTAQGAVPLEDRLIISTYAQALAAGIYRLEADVSLKSTIMSDLHSTPIHLTSGLVIVY